MNREYIDAFGTARHPMWITQPAMDFDEDGLVSSTFIYQRLTMDDYAHDAFEPCNCPVYNHLHTWGVGKCYRPSHWCGRCGKPCHYTEANGEDYAPNYPAIIAVSDCCWDTVHHDWRLTQQVMI